MQFFNDFIYACKNVYYNIQYFFSLDLFGMLKYILYNINTIFYVVIVCIVTYFILRLFVFPEKKSDVHGSATFGNIKDLEEKGLVNDPGTYTILGKKKDEYVCAPYHSVIVAKTRAGKGVGCIIPSLLTYRGSVIVNDIKGENYIITKRRRESMGQDVFIFDPFLIASKETNCFNPLVYINENSPDASTEAKNIATILASQLENSDPFFDLSAQTVIQCGILYICANFDEDKRNLFEVRKFLAQPDKKALLETFMNCENYNGLLKLSASDLAMNIKQDGEVNDTIAGIFTTVSTVLSFLDNPQVSYALSKNDFEIDMFRYQPSSLYIAFSPKHINTCSVLLRLIYSFALNMNIETKKNVKAEAAGLKRMKQNVLFVMDEFAQLGKFGQLKKAISLVGGVGVSMMIIVQSLTQLKEHYGEGAGELIGNAIKLFMGCEDVETAKYISDLCGATTVKTYSQDHKDHKNMSFTQRELMTTGEAIQMDVMKPLLVMGGMRPTRIDRITYYQDNDFKGQYDKYTAG